MKSLLLKTTSPVFLILLLVQVASSQTCTLKLADLPAAPELMGFTLGMTKDQVKARVSQVVFGKTDDFGTSKTTINPDFDPKIDKSTFSGVRSVSLDFLDAHLTSLWFGYDSTFKWHTVDDFVKGISGSLKLPNAWESWRVRGQQLRCADFIMTVTIVSEGPSFRIVDQVAEDTLAARRAAKEEEEAAAAAAAEEQAESVIADNSNKTYYPSECHPAKPINPRDQVAFKSSEEAERAGFTKAKNCAP